MDAFEHVVSEILWMQGYWVRTSKGRVDPRGQAVCRGFSKKEF